MSGALHLGILEQPERKILGDHVVPISHSKSNSWP
jgi:hypothetical protein